MANTIREVIADIETAVEALTPTTDATDTFTFLTAFPSSGALDEIPGNIKHRQILLDIDANETRTSVAGSNHVWFVTWSLRIVHVWKKKDYLEAVKIRTEDIQMIIECVRYKRPGKGNGARLFEVVGEDKSINGHTWDTTLTFSGQVAIPAVVTP